MPTAHYDFELVVHNPQQPSFRQSCVESSEVRAAAAPALAADQAYFEVELHDGDVSHSVFRAWFAADRVCLRVDEHREFYANSPITATQQTTSPVTFRDEDGSPFTVPITDTVTRPEAVAAFDYWLATGTRTPTLHWV